MNDCNCRNCGAPVNPGEVCEYCGTPRAEEVSSRVEITPTGIRFVCENLKGISKDKTRLYSDDRIVDEA